jgi:hypothetical protein
MSRALMGILCVWTACVPCASAQTTEMPRALGANPPPAAIADPCQPQCVAEMPAETDCSDSFHAAVDYLLFWFKPICLNVPIVTVGNPAAPVPGALGQPGTQIAVGGSPPHKLDFGGTSGLRATVGWLRGDGVLGLEVSGLLMDSASDSETFTARPNGTPNSYLPYQATDNSQQALPFTIPGVVTGRSLAIGSTHLWGVEANATFPFSVDRDGYCIKGAFLAGGRYLDLTDRDRIFNALQLVDNPSAVAVGADQVITHNQFYGPQLGARVGLEWGKWSLDYTTKLAAGLTHQVRIYEGAPLLAATEASPLLVPGPLIVLPSNIGRATAERVTLVPEIGLKSRLALNSWCTLSVGYTLIYWNKVLCPGDQMDPTVNVTQLPFHGPVTGSLAPSPLFVHTDYFAQGLEVGLQVRF